MDVQKMLENMRNEANAEIDVFILELDELKMNQVRSNHQFAVAHLDGKIAAWKAARLLIEQKFSY